MLGIKVLRLLQASWHRYLQMHNSISQGKYMRYFVVLFLGRKICFRYFRCITNFLFSFAFVFFGSVYIYVTIYSLWNVMYFQPGIVNIRRKVRFNKYFFFLK